MAVQVSVFNVSRLMGEVVLVCLIPAHISPCSTQSRIASTTPVAAVVSACKAGETHLGWLDTPYILEFRESKGNFDAQRSSRTPVSS